MMKLQNLWLGCVETRLFDAFRKKKEEGVKEDVL